MSSVVEIPLQEILQATNNFAKENLIACGGYGPVYKGKSEKHGMIAVKRLNPKNGQGNVEFRREIDLLSEYKHENIISLLGFCDENAEKILVYKLESNGSLDGHLNNKDLSWIQRLRICIDAARGLKYLHDDVGPQHRILHRDVKSANMLLDENWNAKISDFGLSRIGPANMQTTLLISKACGTFGYIDPEYLHTGCLTQKSDVYSFGVVLFEVLCGRRTHIEAYKDDRQFLRVLVNKYYARQTLYKIVPLYLLNQATEASLVTFSTIAYQCLKNGIERPTMSEVLQQLQKALDDQLAPNESTAVDEHKGSGNYVSGLGTKLFVGFITSSWSWLHGGNFFTAEGKIDLVITVSFLVLLVLTVCFVLMFINLIKQIYNKGLVGTYNNLNQKKNQLFMQAIDMVKGTPTCKNNLKALELECAGAMKEEEGRLQD